MDIEFKTRIGKIKPMHAINNIPLLGTSDKLHHYLGEAGIPFVRLHDTGGRYGQNVFVDIENIFRDWEADENDPKSYDFAFTDWLLNAIDYQGAKIFYRLGATIENSQHIKAYRIYPPKDNMKWARICEKIIAHYNEGWADGYRLDIRYWEIWNEPDNFPDIEDNCMWKGTFEEYMELYKTASTYLKAKFPYIKIGGYASCGFYALFKDEVVRIANSSDRTDYFMDCFCKFMEFARENSLPLDFFSWHSYSDAKKNVEYEKYVRQKLDEYGYTGTESILNEWNPGTKRRGTLEDCAYVSEMMMTMQNTTADMLMYYNGAVHGTYNGLYDPLKLEPFKSYYAFLAFDKLYRLKNQSRVSDIPENVSCIAASSEDKQAALITNTGDACKIKINTDIKRSFKVSRINSGSDLEYSGIFDTPGELELEPFETVMLTG